jgi:hypothetical protein
MRELKAMELEVTPEATEAVVEWQEFHNGEVECGHHCGIGRLIWGPAFSQINGPKEIVALAEYGHHLKMGGLLHHSCTE